MSVASMKNALKRAARPRGTEIFRESFHFGQLSQTKDDDDELVIFFRHEARPVKSESVKVEVRFRSTLSGH